MDKLWYCGSNDYRCPYCGLRLKKVYYNNVSIGYVCPNTDCAESESLQGNINFWEKLEELLKLLNKTALEQKDK